MKKLCFVFLFACLAAGRAHATEFLVLTVSGVNCVTTTEKITSGGIALQAWEWGAFTPTGPNGSKGNPTGPATLSALVVNKYMDQCTGPLLNLSLDGKFSGTVTMTQYTTNTQGENVAAMVVTLSNALVASYEVSGSTTANPLETWGFTFSKICVANKLINASYCYNSVAPPA